MLFRQLFDVETSSFSYLLADEATREAVLIDPVREQTERDTELLEQLELRLRFALETHVHADHVTGGGRLRERTGCQLVVGRHSGVGAADRLVGQGDAVRFGAHALEVRETPGHTEGCVSYVCHEEGMAFTGDALLIRGCGRTDFQGGSSPALFRSVREQILGLPAQTRLYPAHDYRGRTLTTVAEERRWNPRVGDARSLEEFVEIMAALGLPYPRRMDEAVPANLASGVTEPEKAERSARAEDRWAPLLRTESGAPVVGGAWLAGELGKGPGAPRLVDVREPIEFCGPLGHLEGAELVPMAQLDARAEAWEPEAPLVLVCSYGTRSGKAARRLEERGFRRVASLHGGLVRWSQEGRPAVEVLGDRARQDAPGFLGANI